MILVLAAIVAGVSRIARGGGGMFALFEPHGAIAAQESHIIIIAVALMFAVAIPTFIFLLYVVAKYRDDNTKAPYRPEERGGKKAAAFLWGVPALLILVIAVMNWHTTHELDPYKPLDSTTAPITVQVVSLRWKWLFIYPEQHIATVNFLEIPDNTPVNLELTSDAPMNSFWVPQLAGQMYSMAGMSTQLHFIADEPGDFQGRAAEINGPGFAGMSFTVRAASADDFAHWVDTVRNSHKALTAEEYAKLALPSEYVPAAYYASVPDDMYNMIMGKYMSPTTVAMASDGGGAMQGMKMR
jgi:cytochrome o ubiquinol oxidase subunit 2